ncbi:MAG: hypothetical protein ACHQ15_05445, partial [Candidatus Limnocylindrales bacterium]
MGTPAWRAWFGTPWRLATAAMAVVAMAVIGYLFMACQVASPPPTPSPTEPAPSVLPSATFEATPPPGATSTMEPTATAALAPAWTGLDWSLS